jgi:hypothetical protein
MTTRLFVLLARNAPAAVVLRRGPSKQVLLVRWNLSDDSFEAARSFASGCPVMTRIAATGQGR